MNLSLKIVTRHEKTLNIFSHFLKFYLTGEFGWMLLGVGCRIRPASVRLTRGLSSLRDRDHRVSSVSRPGQNNPDRDRVRVPTGRRLLYCWKLLLIIIKGIKVLPFLGPETVLKYHRRPTSQKQITTSCIFYIFDIFYICYTVFKAGVANC